MDEQITIALLSLAITLAVYLWYWRVQLPKEKRRQRDYLRSRGYGFLIDKEEHELDAAEDQKLKRPSA